MDAPNTSMPIEWQKANEALQGVKQTKTEQSNNSSSSTVTANTSSNNITSPAAQSYSQQQQSVFNYGAYAGYWPQMYGFQGYSNMQPMTMPNMNYYNMNYQAPYNPAAFGGYYGFPGMPANNCVPPNMSQMSGNAVPNPTSPTSVQSHSPTMQNRTTADGPSMPSQPPPPPPSVPSENNQADSSQAFAYHSFENNKQAPGSGGIRFNMPKKKNGFMPFPSQSNRGKASVFGRLSYDPASPTPTTIGSSTPESNSSKEFEMKKANLSIKNRDSWPPSLKEYIENAFNSCSPSNKDKLEKILQQKLKREFDKNTIWHKDWSKEPFPEINDRALEKLGKNEKNNFSPLRDATSNLSRTAFNKHKDFSYVRSQPRHKSRFRSRSRSRTRSRSPNFKRIVKKRSSSSRSPSSPDSSNDCPKKQLVSSRIIAPQENRNNKGWWNQDRSSTKKKKNKKRTPIQFSVDSEFSTDDKLQKRAARFEKVGKKEQPWIMNNQSMNDEDPADIDWSSYAIVGTCQDIEKQYFRLTSAVDPSTIRPLEVLIEALHSVQLHWTQHNDYFYVCEQLKSIRQDLMVQCIRNEFTLKAYEIHARLAMEKGDRTEFNQCLSQLKQLYQQLGGDAKLEFTGYYILYCMYTKNTHEIKNILACLTPEEKKHQVINFTLKLNSAWSLNNYHMFFRLYLTAPDMSGYIIDWFVQTMRENAIKAYVKAFRPTLPVKFIRKEFGFDSELECLTFLKEVQCCLTTDESEINCKDSFQALQ